MLRAGVYVRISLDREGRRAGVERQKADCLALCERKGWRAVEIYEDNDTSAFDGGKRPGYDRLCGDVADGQLDVVVAYNQDRLWRDVIEQQLFLAEGRKAGLKLVGTTSGDVDPANADDELVSTILAAMARKESQNTSRRMKRRQLEKAMNGEKHGGHRGFGHTHDRTGTVPAEVKLIKEAARRLIRGDSQRSIVMDWRARAIESATGKAWTVQAFSDLMRQARLIGMRDHHGTLYPTRWAKILDEQTWRQVQAVTASRQTTRKAPTKYLLTGILTCSKCGSPMRGGMKTDGRARYICPPRGVTQNSCGRMVIDGAQTDAFVIDAVLDYLDGPKLAKKLAQLERSATHADVGALIERLEKDRAKLDELAEMFDDGEIDRAEYGRRKQRIADRIAVNEKKLTAGTPTPTLTHIGQGAKLRKAWNHLLFDERRDVLVAALDRVDVYPPQTSGRTFQADRLDPLFRL